MRLLSRKTTGEITFDIANIVLLILLCLGTLYPFLYVVSRSVMQASDRALHPFAILPRERITLEAYEFIFNKGSKIFKSYAITIFRTVVGTVLSVIVEAMFAYALSKKYFPPRKFLSMAIAITMWFSAGLIPNFLVVRAVGLYNNIWVYVMFPLMSAWYVFIMRTFFSQIPDSLEESARMDGASDVAILIRIILPLSTPVLATISLFHAVYHWNEWFSGIIFIADPTKIPVQALLYQILRMAEQSSMNVELITFRPPPSISVQMAMIVVTAFPIVAAYPFFQKHFVKGMLIGSIKG
jgi:putative aldouronate transport system permease protein